jgi:cytochrome c2
MLRRPLTLAAATAATLVFSEAAAQQCDAAAGEKVFARCRACHKVEEGANGVGPHLFGIVGRPVAGVEGFNYSDPMREFGADGSVVWDHEHLATYLEDPRGTVKGTKMVFAGLRKPEERDAVICYLDTLK